ADRPSPARAPRRHAGRDRARRRGRRPPAAGARRRSDRRFPDRSRRAGDPDGRRLRPARGRRRSLGSGRWLKIRARFGLQSVAGRWLNATGAHRSITRGVLVSVLDRAALEDSPLADLHAIASELSIDGYRRLRRPALIDVILDKQEGGEAGPPGVPDSVDGEAQAEPKAQKPRSSRRRSAKPAASDDQVAAFDVDQPAAFDVDQPAVSEPAVAESGDAEPAHADSRADADEDAPAPRRRRGRRGGRARTSVREETSSAEEEEREEAPSADQGA